MPPASSSSFRRAMKRSATLPSGTSPLRVRTGIEGQIACTPRQVGAGCWRVAAAGGGGGRWRRRVGPGAAAAASAAYAGPRSRPGVRAAGQEPPLGRLDCDRALTATGPCPGSPVVPLQHALPPGVQEQQRADAHGPRWPAGAGCAEFRPSGRCWRRQAIWGCRSCDRQCDRIERGPAAGRGCTTAAAADPPTVASAPNAPRHHLPCSSDAVVPQNRGPSAKSIAQSRVLRHIPSASALPKHPTTVRCSVLASCLCISIKSSCKYVFMPTWLVIARQKCH